MKRLLSLWVVLAGLLAGGLPAQEVRIQVLATTDMHGHITAQNSYSLTPEPKGWAKIATMIRQRREANPNTVLVDCGDTLQGEPVNYVQSHLRQDLPEPSIAIMNALGYAAMAVGNHEYDFGMGVLRAAEKQARFPFLSANTFHPKSRKEAFPAFTKVTVGGVSVLIVGFTTPGVPSWEPPANYGGLGFADIVETARTLIPKLRDREKADVVVVAMHSGLGTLPGATGDENAALRLAEQVPGIDLILTGHTHSLVKTQHKGIPILQGRAHGRALMTADLVLRKAGARWQLVAAQGDVVETAETVPDDAEALALTGPLRAATETYLNTFATNLQTDLDCRFARMEDTPAMQLLHQVQRQATGAQLSAAACIATQTYIPKGATSVRQFYALMPYENGLVRLKVTGEQVRRYLEHAARYYNYSHLPDLYAKGFGGYNFDTLDGVAYAMDISKAPGGRITTLTYNSQPVRPDQTFTLAMSSYRYYGGGGYKAAVGWTAAPEATFENGLRNDLLAFVLARPSLNPVPVRNWRIIPALDRERILQLKR
ncbi:MAG: bifunctional metallophosphatase/5'-nucleotidase [Holophagaceae bacterium]|nr:bifunctional metallophosphatase/5'-nucleotidase [Holophagaceae bacterium]